MLEFAGISKSLYVNFEEKGSFHCEFTNVAQSMYSQKCANLMIAGIPGDVKLSLYGVEKLVQV